MARNIQDEIEENYSQIAEEHGIFRPPNLVPSGRYVRVDFHSTRIYRPHLFNGFSHTPGLDTTPLGYVHLLPPEPVVEDPKIKEEEKKEKEFSRILEEHLPIGIIENVRCNVCLEIHSSPLVTPCGHYTCRVAVEGIKGERKDGPRFGDYEDYTGGDPNGEAIKRNELRYEALIPCPVCKELIPHAGIVTNIPVKGMLEVFHRHYTCLDSAVPDQFRLVQSESTISSPPSTPTLSSPPLPNHSNEEKERESMMKNRRGVLKRFHQILWNDKKAWRDNFFKVNDRYVWEVELNMREKVFVGRSWSRKRAEEVACFFAMQVFCKDKFYYFKWAQDEQNLQ